MTYHDFEHFHPHLAIWGFTTVDTHLAQSVNDFPILFHKHPFTAHFVKLVVHACIRRRSRYGGPFELEIF